MALLVQDCAWKLTWPGLGLFFFPLLEVNMEIPELNLRPIIQKPRRVRRIIEAAELSLGLECGCNSLLELSDGLRKRNSTERRAACVTSMLAKPSSIRKLMSPIQSNPSPIHNSTMPSLSKQSDPPEEEPTSNSHPSHISPPLSLRSPSPSTHDRLSTVISTFLLANTEHLVCASGYQVS